MNTRQTEFEEAANAATHGMGFVLSLLATAQLLSAARHRSGPVVVACGVYAATLLLLYGISTLSHIVREPAWRRWWRMLDQCCIFLLIAGSYTPFAEVYFNHGSWWVLLAGMWCLAIAGVVRVVYVGDLPRSNKVAYGLLGLLPIVTLPELSAAPPVGLTFWLVAGGAFYLIGTIFLRLNRIQFSHTCWHLFVIAGSACHYWAILNAVRHGPR